jgi:hypothetical protein
MSDPKKVLPSQLTEEELLKLLEQEETPLSPEESQPITEEDILDIGIEQEDNVVPFLVHYNIVPGKKAVSKRLLYDLYRNHVDEPLDALRFNHRAGKYLPQYYNINGAFYQISQDSFKLSSQLLKLKRARREIKTLSHHYRKKFEKFLEECEITAGQHWVQGYIIYEIYLEYIKKQGKKVPAFALKSFIQLLKVYFPKARKTSNRSLWFNVNEKTFNHFDAETKKSFEERRRKKKRKKQG